MAKQKIAKNNTTKRFIEFKTTTIKDAKSVLIQKNKKATTKATSAKKKVGTIPSNNKKIKSNSNKVINNSKIARSIPSTKNEKSLTAVINDKKKYTPSKEKKNTFEHYASYTKSEVKQIESDIEMHKGDLKSTSYVPTTMLGISLLGFIGTVIFTASGKFTELFKGFGDNFGISIGFAMSLAFLIMILASIISMTPKDNTY